ncbi:MAG: YegS/Rv2252/BmrU family lipid kinase [Bacteroidetes bacterium]|nr:YegS/Rv2252/BmrU family lipid kinase [Bacteroidota bacterium]
MPKRSVHFILNPVSGSGQNKLNIKFIRSVLNTKNYDFRLKISQKPGDVCQLTKLSIHEGANVIVACGGDGTINQVASQLIGTKVKLGIIKYGSGNGLASHLGIPNELIRALEVIKNEKAINIDVGIVNQHYFFSNMSIGVGARVINHYTDSKKRQFMSDFRAVLKGLLSEPLNMTLDLVIDGYKTTITPLVLFISNSNEMGYNVSFTPDASLQDGKLDLVFTEHLSLFQKILFANQIVFFKKRRFKKAQYLQAEDILITNKKNEEFLMQLDGESIVVNSNVLRISLKKTALSVIVPI